ncbi:putative Mg(2+) transport ATPase [Andreesenia angusta]|uniref:Putative Mg(2+) transport ATPase n=1 Tax=Andreesenia angusta TaxID=39480 RepID=A0A1S1V9J5_9FIRM|nr:MgtC/SapB family protein [Andreesenia angusta]OHW62797.1 putative Mg(2+) transport ATPase [Andreesenia angusta]
MLSTESIVFKLILSIILSGAIGIERESLRRPAGLRTHILVCVGSTLVMLTSLYLFEIFKDTANMQPDRLGAQVISGIGFLGAGTIIRDGNNVKGLTTAAGLWAVACIGLAVGAGFYVGAIASSLLVLFTLIAFGRIEKYLGDDKYIEIEIVSKNRAGQIGIISNKIGAMGIKIVKIDSYAGEDEEELVVIEILMSVNRDLNRTLNRKLLVKELSKLPGIVSVKER